jgi:hypothetical protein
MQHTFVNITLAYYDTLTHNILHQEKPSCSPGPIRLQRHFNYPHITSSPPIPPFPFPKSYGVHTIMHMPVNTVGESSMPEEGGNWEPVQGTWSLVIGADDHTGHTLGWGPTMEAAQCSTYRHLGMITCTDSENIAMPHRKATCHCGI